MPLPWAAHPLALFCAVSLGGSVLGLVGLMRSSSPRRGAWLALTVALEALIAAFVGLTVVNGGPPAVWGPPALLLGVCLAFHLLQSGPGRRLAVAGLGGPVRHRRVRR